MMLHVTIFDVVSNRHSKEEGRREQAADCFNTGRILAVGSLAVTVRTGPVGATTTPPTTIAANCSADVGRALGDWLSSLPPNSVVTLPIRCLLPHR